MTEVKTLHTSKSDQGDDFYRLLYETSADAIMTIEPPDWRYTSGNPATLKIFGVASEKELLTLTPADLSPKSQPDGQDSNTKAIKMIEKALKDGSNFFDWTHQKYHGEPFPSQVLLTRVKIGEKALLQVTVRDISSQKDLEKKYQNISRELEVMIDNVPAWIFYKDKKNNFIRVNKTFSQVLEKEKKDIEGKSCYDIFPKDQADAFLKDDLEVINADKPKMNIIEPMQSKNGTMWAKTDKIPYRNENGEVIGIIGFTLDITDQKIFEDELAEKVEEAEKLNRLMVGRELKMIELKKEIQALKNNPNTAPSQEENKFEEGIKLEEDVVQSLETDYESMIVNSNLESEQKNSINVKLKILLSDSQKHEKALKDLE